MDHIDIKNLSVCLKNYKILRSVSFTIKKGQCIGLIGKNGAGKTTLFDLICGVQKVNNGEIVLHEFYLSTEQLKWSIRNFHL